MSKSNDKIKHAVFIIKEKFTNFDYIIEEDKYEEKRELADKYGVNGTIYIGHNNDSSPVWYGKLKEGIMDAPELSNKSTRAVMLIKRNKRIFAFVFGHGKHMIKSETFERNFGMKVVLNNCQVDKLKSIDTTKIDSVTVQSRTQTSKSSELQEFQVDNIRDLLKAVTAEAKDSSRYGNVISGRDSFHYNYPFSYENIRFMCDRLLDDYQSDKYKVNFEWVDHLHEENDPIIIDSLNQEMLKQINDIYHDKEEYNIHLAPPEIVDMENDLKYSYHGAGEKFNELEVSSYLINKNPRVEFTIEKLKRDRIFVFNDSLEQLETKWSIYNCLITEVQHKKRTYIFSLGSWYSVDNDFVSKVNNFIRDIPTCNLNFHHYDTEIHTCENTYNESIPVRHNNVISMDRNNIIIDKSRFELCDLLTNEKHLIHVKPWKSSSTLSHLFAQGRISATTLIKEPNIIPQINEKIQEKGGDKEFQFANEINGPQYTVVYAIIYEGDKEVHERIPFFSKLNFMDSVNSLRIMQFNVEKMHIKKIDRDKKSAMT